MKRKPMKLKLKKGALHKALGVPESKKIPKEKLEKAKHSKSALMRKRATFAENAKKWNHSGKKRK